MVLRSPFRKIVKNVNFRRSARKSADNSFCQGINYLNAFEGFCSKGRKKSERKLENVF